MKTLTKDMLNTTTSVLATVTNAGTKDFKELSFRYEHRHSLGIYELKFSYNSVRYSANYSQHELNAALEHYNRISFGEVS